MHRRKSELSLQALPLRERSFDGERAAYGTDGRRSFNVLQKHRRVGLRCISMFDLYGRTAPRTIAAGMTVSG